jgi:acyl-CoA synthetase (NDP forming)
MTKAYDLIDRIFHPGSVAFVGVTTSDPTHWTRVFWNSALEFQFQGPLYAVNPHGGEIDGYKVFRSIDEIPGTVDYAVSTVSARIASKIVRDCARKGVKAIHFCTAGFAETGDEDVADLQKELVKAGRETGVRIIGPNCMGIYCPESRLAFDTAFPKESGSVGFISQSGGNAIYTIREADWKGIRFSKVVSFGNACDLNESDFLEYMIEDPKTKIIALYLEGVQDGKKFRRLLEKAASVKPVVLVKGGCGEAGARATSSHTGSLAGNNDIWDALCRQLNVIKAKNMEEMVDVMATLQFMPDFKGQNMLLIGPGGGASVMITDEFERKGFKLPAVTDKIRKELLGFSQAAGNMLRNPIDYSQSMHNPESIRKALRLLTEWDQIDLCVWFFRPSQMPDNFLDLISQVAGMITVAFEASAKPVAQIIEHGVVPVRQSLAFKMAQKVAASGKPVYYSFPAAAQALRLVADYNLRKEART